ncbi:MAG: diguanylate cyclase [bacterium]
MIKNTLSRVTISLLLIFNFIVLLCSTGFGIDVKDLEGKSEEELYNMAVQYYKKFDDKSAYIICVHIIKNLNNKNKNAFYLLTEILIRNIYVSSDKQKIYNEILKYADYIINNIDFYDARAYYYKGWVYHSLGDFASAEYNLKKSLQNNPSYIPSMILLLDIYISKKDFQEAIKMTDRIISKGYLNKDFAYLILKLYIENEDLNKASEFASKYQYLLVDEKSFYLIAVLNYKQGYYQKALEQIEKILAKYPENQEYLKLKVKILHALKKYKQAYEIIKQTFQDTKDEEILIIKKEIETRNTTRYAVIAVTILLLVSCIIAALYLYNERKNKQAKRKIENIKKVYQEAVSIKAENLDIFISLVYEFFNNNILGFNARMAIYITDPRKDNVLYCYFNNASDDLPDVLYIFPKYSAWLSEYSNTPVHLLSIQSNPTFYDWFGGKNIVNFKKQKMHFILPCVSKGLLQSLIFIQALTETEENKILQNLRTYKEVIKEVLEEISNDIVSIRFKEVAYLDELTRLYNRRFMYQKMEEELEKASKNNQKLSYILCDIDNFKKFNDTYGHQVGDEVLRVVAKVFKAAAREFFDWPFRYGGEEIGIIIPNTPTEKAYEIAERIRQEVSSRKFENVPTVITISLGLATFPDHGKNVEEIIKAADEALYYSKKTGKNKTTIAGVKVLVDVTQDNSQQTVQQTPQQTVQQTPQQTIQTDQTQKQEKQPIGQVQKDAQLKATMEFKIPPFVYSMDKLEEYYNTIKNNYKHAIMRIEANIDDKTQKMINDIYHNLILMEAVGAKVENGKITIQIILVDRDEKDIQKMVSDLMRKYNVEPTIKR